MKMYLVHLTAAAIPLKTFDFLLRQNDEYNPFLSVQLGTLYAGLIV